MTSPTTPDSIKVMSWNVLVSEPRSERVERLISDISSVSPDVMCLQEAWYELTAAIEAKLDYRLLAHRSDSDGKVSAVLSRLPLVRGTSPESLELPGWGEAGARAAAAGAIVQSPTGRRWRVVSTHLAWGSLKEGVRLEQAEYLDSMAEAAQTRVPEEVQVLCGDLNAQPDGRTVRFLTGRDLGAQGTSTLWVDAWEHRGEGAGYTSDPSLPQAKVTARAVGILRTDLLPHRRIDYVLVKGYAHGRPGCPITAVLHDAKDVSDHHGVVVELWDPAAVAGSL